MPQSLRTTALPRGFVEPCLPTTADKPPAGDRWLHEIKHDGMRLLARRVGPVAVQLFTRNGTDWTKRYPAIVQAVTALDVASVYIDGEVVVCDTNGMASFDLLRSRRHDETAFLFAFDLIELNGADMRALPLEDRKARLARVLRKAAAGLQFNEHLLEDGAAVFAHACRLGCEGIVSKRRDSRYMSGRTDAWLKSKNALAPAVRREALEDWGRQRQRR